MMQPLHHLQFMAVLFSSMYLLCCTKLLCYNVFYKVYCSISSTSKFLYYQIGFPKAAMSPRFPQTNHPFSFCAVFLQNFFFLFSSSRL